MYPNPAEPPQTLVGNRADPALAAARSDGGAEMKRRNFFKTAAIGSAAFVPLPLFADAQTVSDSARSPHNNGDPPDNPFAILLQGTYAPASRCPELDLFQVNVCDGSYSTVKIYPVVGLSDKGREHHRDNRGGARGCNTEKAIGDFYVQFGGEFAVYDLPGGALAMRFRRPDGDHTVPVSDGHGGIFYVGTIDLDIIEATGMYQPFLGGTNQMADNLHVLADGTAVEYCFCIISLPS
jgi:hypothetical protein